MTDARATIAITTGGPLARELRALFSGRGVDVIEAPVIRAAPAANPRPFAAALEQLEAYDCLVFTSARAAQAALDERPPPWPVGLEVATVGDATARPLGERGVKVTLTGDGNGASGLAPRLVAKLRGARILVPQSAIALDTLTTALRDAGHLVHEVVAYQIEPDPEGVARLEASIREKKIAALIVTSPSSIRALASHVHETPAEFLGALTLVAIGPTTAAAMRELELAPQLTAQSANATALAASLTTVTRS